MALGCLPVRSYAGAMLWCPHCIHLGESLYYRIGSGDFLCRVDANCTQLGYVCAITCRSVRTDETRRYLASILTPADADEVLRAAREGAMGQVT